MVFIADGRFELPDNLLYSTYQHVYFNKEKKTIGLDQLGFAYLQKPYELKILIEDSVKIREPFAVISTQQGITTLYSPVAGTIKKKTSKCSRRYGKRYLFKGFYFRIR